ncbi:hypothetical protein QEJ61_gp19 [Curtobacterium phage Pize]|uniref:hypothetical protein n=1 Tax=Curtobacterium phage Pize TaxID=2851068 RepID=UPI0021FFE5A1|nr:hypothetical protein QEJ61_gp19 [Curtobacterium phage Pize]QXG07751.1 hypothetical protein [Curtobacterium phage Pize]
MSKRITEIKYGSIREKDEIRVEGEYADMRIRREGVVERIVSHPNSWEFVTKQGYTLLVVQRDGTRSPAKAVIHLLRRNIDTPLFDI